MKKYFFQSLVFIKIIFVFPGILAKICFLIRIWIQEDKNLYRSGFTFLISNASKIKLKAKLSKWLALWLFSVPPARYCQCQPTLPGKGRKYNNSSDVNPYHFASWIRFLKKSNDIYFYFNFSLYRT